MSEPTTLLNSTEVLGSLIPEDRAVVAEAEELCREAATLYDCGIARGLLLGLLRRKRIGKAEFNALFDRVWSLVPPAVVASIPLEHRASYRAGVVVPASLATRRERQAGKAPPAP